MNRERSYSDVHNLQVEFKTLLRQKSSDGSCEASEEFIVDFVEVQCFLHTGMILDVSVHPDDSIFQIKQIILNSATADGKHTGTFDSNFSDISKSYSKFGLPYKDGSRAVMGIK